MSFSAAIATCLSKYAIFSGRARRSEFWWFYLFCVIMAWGATLVGHASGLGDWLAHIVNFAFFIPILAASSRRLHDTGRSGWWFLLTLTLIGIIPVVVWWASEGKQEDNSYGVAAS